MTETTTDHTFDYVPRLVDANLPYRMGVAGDTSKSRYWTPGATLHQGGEGACVPHGVTGEALASPVRVKLPNAQALAFEGYDWCRRHDEFEGDYTDGTSVRAGMNWGRERGWWTGYRWGLNMGELRAALDLGPVVVGVDWTDGMYDPAGDEVVPTGKVVGGHCILITGYSAARASYRLKNSWGPQWGRNGQAYIRAVYLDRILFQAGGEAAVPQGRKA
jgi:hypothetical protein